MQPSTYAPCDSYSAAKDPFATAHIFQLQHARHSENMHLLNKISTRTVIYPHRLFLQPPPHRFLRSHTPLYTIIYGFQPPTCSLTIHPSIHLAVGCFRPKHYKTLALEHRGPRCCVCLLPIVQVVQDTRVRSLVRSGQAHARRRLARRSALDVNLRALLFAGKE